MTIMNLTQTTRSHHAVCMISMGVAALLSGCSSTVEPQPSFTLPNSWVRVTENSEAVFYINPDTLVIDGDRRRHWEMQDLKARDPQGEWSRQAALEYDCTVGRARAFHYADYDGPMASGTRLRSGGVFNPAWRAVPTDTPTYTILKRLCEE